MGRQRDVHDLENRRRRAGKLFERGLNQSDVARRLGVSRQSAMRWHRAWKQTGMRGLRGAGRLGRRPRVDNGQRTTIDQALRKGPQAHGFGTDLWTLPRVARVIERITGVRYHSGHVWRVLRGLGWSLQRPTTRARERDEAAVKRWIRVRWPQLKKTPLAEGPR